MDCCLNRAALVATCLLTVPAAAAESWEERYGFVAQCQAEMSETVAWDAAGITVRVEARLSPGEDTWPRLERMIHLPDGRKIDLGGGGKMNEEPQDCGDYLVGAIGPTLQSLEAGPHGWRTTDDVFDTLWHAKSCALPDNWDPRDPGQVACRDAKALADGMSIDLAQRWGLAGQPLLAVPYSAYGVDVMAVDMDTLQLTALGFDGC